MATPERATGMSFPPSAAPSPAEPAIGPRNGLARLAALHREAEEVARLANLLGRAPYAGVALGAAAALTAALGFSAAASPAQLAAWLMLVGLALLALGHAYRRTIRAPFERAPLNAFAEDLKAIQTYAGFAWGAGAFLALPATTGPLAAVAFVVLPVALIAATLRVPGTALLFAAPAVLLSAGAMLLRPLPQGLLAAGLSVLVCALTLAAAYAAGWAQSRRLPQIAELPLA